MNRKESSVCKKCLEQNSSGISLLKNVCNGNHSGSEAEQKVRVMWSGAEKRLVVVGVILLFVLCPKQGFCQNGATVVITSFYATGIAVEEKAALTLTATKN